MTARRGLRSSRSQAHEMSRSRNILIFRAVVETNDSAAVARLLDLVPDSAKLHPPIQKRFAEIRYDPETRREYWIGGDDEHIVCVMITGIGVDEVPKIRALFDRPGRHSFNTQDLVSHAAHVTGGAVHLMY
jgi:hypothetical protein